MIDVLMGEDKGASIQGSPRKGVFSHIHIGIMGKTATTLVIFTNLATAPKSRNV
jgi:hypothetical protein